MVKHPESKPSGGVVLFTHVAVTVVRIKRLQLAAHVIPFVGQWVPLKSDPVKTSDPLRVEFAVFERPALSMHPGSKSVWGVMSQWHVAVTMVRLIRL